MKKLVFLSAIALLFLVMGCHNRADRDETKEETVITKSDTTEANRDSLLDAINKTLLDTIKK